MTNANFPNIENGWGASWATNGGDVPLDRYVDVTKRSDGAVGTTRGRQYELDQVQSGTMTYELSDNNGALDPTNASGPYFGHIWPYQPCRVRAQWPPTANLFTPAIASCAGLAVGLADQGNSGPGMFGPSLAVVASASAFAGTQVWSVPVASGTAADSFIIETLQPAIEPGVTYSLSVRARNVTDSTTQPIYLSVTWRDATGATVASTHSTAVALVGSSTATGWTSFTVTSTAPANAAQVALGLASSSSFSAALTIQSNAWQWQIGQPTAYGDPGTWYPLFSGYVERWPQSWTRGGSYSVVTPTAVDAFALLSQRTLRDPLTEEIAKHNPRFLFRLDDPQYSQQVADATGNNPPAPTATNKQGPGVLTFGNQITATDPVNGVFASDGTVCTISNSSPGTGNYDKATFISLDSAGISGPAGTFSQDFTRVIAFRYTGPVPSPGAMSTVWGANSKNKANLSGLVLGVSNNQKASVVLNGPVTGITLDSPGPTVCDGNWHFMWVVWTAATQGFTIGSDGVNGGTFTATTQIPNSLGWDTVGATLDTNGSAWNYKGDLAFAAEFPSALSGFDLNSLYNAWRNAFSGDSTDERYSRVLGYAGYIGPRSIDVGQTQSMGPMAIDGQDALSALQDVVDTENGEHFVSAGGSVTFKARSARYNAGSPIYTFGEQELPYEDVALDYDPTHLANLVQVTQAATGQVFTAEDAASQAAYFPRTMQRTINATSAFECQDATNYLVSRYKNPLTRVDSIVLNPSANTALWPVCLSLELGMRIRIIRRPFGRPSITVDCFIESIAWSLNPETGEAKVTLQCSPIDATPYGSLAAWHTTLNGAHAAGTTTLTINAPADNMNALVSQLSAGTVLTISPAATVSKENVTVKSVTSTGSPWATGTITLVSGTAHSHTNGAPLCEALPVGVTDPSTWDAVSEYDNHAFVY